MHTKDGLGPHSFMNEGGMVCHPVVTSGETRNILNIVIGLSTHTGGQEEGYSHDAGSAVAATCVHQAQA